MRRPASTPSAGKAAAAVRITRIGAAGDGVGELPDGRRVYASLTLPGELAELRLGKKRGDGWAASVEALSESSPERVAPPCPHFGTCGGCALQHWADAPYAAWKRARLTEALSRAGYPDAAVAPLQRTPPAARRRMDFCLRRGGGGVTVGLHQRGSAAVAEIFACAVLHPRLEALLGALRAMLPGLSALRREGAAVVNLLDTGPDLLLRTDAPLTAMDRTLLADFARAEGLPRIARALGDAAPETACQLGPATIALGGVAVAPPPGAFLQASAAGEAAIVAAVLAALPDKPGARVVELFAGCGTLSLPLSARARVRAFEGDAAAVACLRRAAAGRRLEVVQRDLARQPLQAAEFAAYDAAVLDPPFAGAAAQMAPLAAANVPLIIYVSCNPAALARDAGVLQQAGFELISATPIDQFLWSARLESVVVLARKSYRQP